MNTRFPLRLLTAALALSALAGCATRPVGEAASTLDLRLIAFNDFHGNLQTPATGLRDRDPQNPERFVLVRAGGAAHLASAIDQAKAGQRHTAVVAAGDLIGATPLVSALQRDQPTIETLNVLGLDFSSVGNHEFDRGLSELKRMQAGGCHPADPCPPEKRFEGARFKYLAANVFETATGKTVFPAYEIRNYDGIPVAFVGLVLKGAPAIIAKSATVGLEFRDEADTLNALIPEIRSRGAEAIVVLIHEGGEIKGHFNDPACPNFAGDIINLVKRFDRAVDAVVSGHTHQAYVCKVDGRPVTSAASYGRALTTIDLKIDRKSRDVVSADARNLLVDPKVYPARADVAERVERYLAEAAPLAGRVVGKVKGELSLATDAAGQSRLGAVVADAHLAAMRDASKGGAQIAFTNPGGLRAPVFSRRPDDGVTYGELFTAQPFGNNVVTMTMTGEHLKRALESQFPAQGNPSIYYVSQGLTYSFDLTRPVGDRIVPGTLKLNDEPIKPEGRYRVAMNSFMAGHAIFKEATDRLVGPLDIDALVEYLAHNTPDASRIEARVRRVDNAK